MLVVDDDLDSLDLIRRILGDEGATAITAGSAAEGLAAIDKQSPDVLISDIGMPETDGYELMRKVRSLQPKLGGSVPWGRSNGDFARTQDRTSHCSPASLRMLPNRSKLRSSSRQSLLSPAAQDRPNLRLLRTRSCHPQ